MTAEVKPFVLEPDDEPTATTQEETSRATAALMLALKALSQRAVASLATVASVAAVFWLYLSIPSPNVYQLVQLGMFSCFVLACNWIVRRGRW